MTLATDKRPIYLWSRRPDAAAWDIRNALSSINAAYLAGELARETLIERLEASRDGWQVIEPNTEFHIGEEPPA